VGRENLAARQDEPSAAEIAAACFEAGGRRLMCGDRFIMVVHEDVFDEGGRRADALDAALRAAGDAWQKQLDRVPGAFAETSNWRARRHGPTLDGQDRRSVL